MKLSPEERKVRDERILTAARAGVKDSDILKDLRKDYPDITRNVVISLRHRHDIVKTPDQIREANRENLENARKLRPRIYTPKRPLLPVELAPQEKIPTRAGNRWVPWTVATGCRWIEGDVREGTALVCNARRCRVRGADDNIVEVNYCGEHWHKRRAANSRFTKVIV